MIPKTAQRLMEVNEGVRLAAYLDTAKPPVPSIGLGHTKGVKMGDTCTLEQAMAWFEEEWNDYYLYVQTHVRPDTLPRELEAFTSFAYNVGKSAFGGSTLRNRHNTRLGNVEEAFLMWNKAGGRVQQGLINRRKREYAYYAGLPWDQQKGSTNVSVMSQVRVVLPLLVQQAQIATDPQGQPLSNADKAGQVVEAVIEAIPAAAPFSFLIHLLVTSLVNLYKKHHADFVPTEDPATQQPLPGATGNQQSAQAAPAAFSPSAAGGQDHGGGASVSGGGFGLPASAFHPDPADDAAAGAG